MVTWSTVLKGKVPTPTVRRHTICILDYDGSLISGGGFLDRFLGSGEEPVVQALLPGLAWQQRGTNQSRWRD